MVLTLKQDSKGKCFFHFCQNTEEKKKPELRTVFSQDPSRLPCSNIRNSNVNIEILFFFSSLSHSLDCLCLTCSSELKKFCCITSVFLFSLRINRKKFSFSDLKRKIRIKVRIKSSFLNLNPFYFKYGNRIQEVLVQVVRNVVSLISWRKKKSIQTDVRQRRWFEPPGASWDAIWHFSTERTGRFSCKTESIFWKQLCSSPVMSECVEPSRRRGETSSEVTRGSFEKTHVYWD